MKKHLLFICLFIIPFCSYANSSLTSEQKERAESAVKTYFSLLAEYAKQPMGAEALEIRNDIVLMFENMFEAPVYNDLQALKSKTNLEASCTIDDYLLAFGLLNDQYSYTFEITYDSIECQPLQIPSFAEGYDDLNALVYVNKHIKGGGISEDIKNVFRFNLNTNKISYIEKASFSTNNEDVNFLLKNHLGYSTAKLNELASRCYQEKKYKQAYKLYEQAAIRDDLDSQLSLVNMLYKKQGCEEYVDIVRKEMLRYWLSRIYLKTKPYIENDTEKKVIQLLKNVFGKEYKDSLILPIGKQPFSNGLMCAFNEKQEAVGYINELGEIIIPFKYSSFWHFTEGLVSVQFKEKFGFIDNQNKLIIPFEYDLAYPFYNGSAVVMKKRIINNEECKRYFLINTQGEIISEEFDYMAVSYNCQLILAERGGQFGFVDREGNIKIPFIYDGFKVSNLYASSWLDSKYIAVRKGGKWGFIDASSFDGDFTIPIIYENVTPFMFGKASVLLSKNSGWFYINNRNEILCGPFHSCLNFDLNGVSVVQMEQNSDLCYLINSKGEPLYVGEIFMGKPCNFERIK